MLSPAEPAPPAPAQAPPLVTAVRVEPRLSLPSGPVAAAAPAPREVTDFDGLRAIGEMDRDAVRAMMDEFVGSPRGPGLRAGQRIRGRITSVGQASVFIDVGGKSDAAIDRLELGDVRVGEVLDAFVLSTEGEIRLTVTPSGSAVREMLQEALSAKLAVDGRISAVAAAGWQVQLADGVRAFCPASHTGAPEVAEPALVGRTLPFHIHDLRGRDVVVSRRAIVESEERAAEAGRIGALQVNDVVEGTVASVQDFGAFVKLPNGVQGLVHISNLADRRVKHPSEVVKEGDVVKVRVLGIDPARRRVDLGMKQAGEMSAAPPAGSGPVNPGFGVFASLLRDVKVRK